MSKLIVKGWCDFQHYSKRNPPWIKLHKKLLDNYDFHCLPDASKALAPFLWLLASESDDGSIAFEPKKIAFRLHMTEGMLVDALKPLINGGFIECDDTASTALAPCKQDAHLETEEEKEEEKEKDAPLDAADNLTLEFEQWYSLYPLKVARKPALKAYRTARKTVSQDVLIAAVNRYIKNKPAWKEYANPSTWLNQERWLDAECAPPPEQDRPDPERAFRDMASMVRRGIPSTRTIISQADMTRMVAEQLVTEEQAQAYGWINSGAQMVAAGELAQLAVRRA